MCVKIENQIFIQGVFHTGLDVKKKQWNHNIAHEIRRILAFKKTKYALQ